MDHDRAVDLLGGGKRIAQLGDPVRANDVCAETLGVRREIDRQIRRGVALAVEAPRARPRLAELRPESVGPERPR